MQSMYVESSLIFMENITIIFSLATILCNKINFKSVIFYFLGKHLEWDFN